LSLYRFRQHLFQHYLYHALDELERAYLHEAVGLALEALHGEQTETIAVQLARHFEQAGLTEKAVSYLLRAGQRAGRLSANEEAIGHLRRGLALLQSLPDRPERSPQELEFQIALGNALLATKGFAAPEVGQAYRQAQVLCQKIGETPQLFPVLHGLHRFYLLRGELTTAHEVGEQMLNLAQGRQDPLLLVPAHRVLETSLWFQGEFGQAQAHLEQALALYDSRQHPIYVSLYGLDEGVVCLVDTGCVLWFLGYPDQAVQRSGEAISLAQKLAHPFSLALAMNLAILPYQLRRETQRVQEQAEVAVDFLTEHGFAHWLAVNAMYQGWGRVVQKQEKTGFTQMRQGLTTYQTTGAETVLPYFLGMLAEGYLKVGQVESGLRALSEALAVVNKNGERWCEAELYRLKGELSLKAGTKTESEDCFRRAIEIARRQQARSLELRATVSLSRLWHQEEKKGEARQMLAEIYGWFTEGFETVDLKEAKTLLEALSS
jgi:predicted ATPase